MPERENWKDARNRETALDRLAAALANGHTVILPTESTYVLTAAADQDAAVNRLPQGEGWRSVLVLDRGATALDLLGKPTLLERRLIDRCLPGPIAFINARLSLSTVSKKWPLGAAAQSRMNGQGIPFRVIDHEAVHALFDRLRRPLVAVGQDLGPSSRERIAREQKSERGPVDADTAIRIFPDADLLLDDGSTKYRQQESVAILNGDGFEMVSEGVVSASRLRRLASEVITFVCTGNSCRSPMAEAICKRLLADRLRCEPSELVDRGFTITSAGLAASGGPASRFACSIMQEQFRISLADHVSQNLTPEMVDASDRILVMTDEHRQVLLQYWPEHSSKIKLICGKHDVMDPIGGSRDRYQQTADGIAHCLDRLIDELAGSRQNSSS